MDRLTSFEARPYSPDNLVIRLTFTDNAGFFSCVSIDDAQAKDLLRRMIVALGKWETTYPAYSPAPDYTAYIINGIHHDLPATDANGDAMDPAEVKRIQAAEEAAITAWYAKHPKGIPEPTA